MNRKRKYNDEETNPENKKMVESKFFKKMVVSRDPVSVVRDLMKKLRSLKFTLSEITDLLSELMDGMLHTMQDRIYKVENAKEFQEANRDMRRIFELHNLLSEKNQMKRLDVFELVVERFPENITGALTYMIETAKEEEGTSGTFAKTLDKWVNDE